VSLTLVILLWYRREYVGSHSPVNAERSRVVTQREDEGFGLLGVCHGHPDPLTRVVRPRGCWKPRLGPFQQGAGGGKCLSGLERIPLIFKLHGRCPARLPPGDLHQGDHMATYYRDLAVRHSYSRHLLIEETPDRGDSAVIWSTKGRYRLDDLLP